MCTVSSLWISADSVSVEVPQKLLIETHEKNMLTTLCYVGWLPQ